MAEWLKAAVLNPDKNGRVAERLNAPVLKTGIAERRSRVRISPLPLLSGRIPLPPPLYGVRGKKLLYRVVPWVRQGIHPDARVYTWANLAPSANSNLISSAQSQAPHRAGAGFF